MVAYGIHNADALQAMAEIPSGSVDLIATDPPFGIKFGARKTNYNRDGTRVMDGYVEVPEEVYFDFTCAWMREAYRMLKPSGCMYVVSGWSNLIHILNGLQGCNFTTINHNIWKYQFGVYTKRKFVTSHYHVLFVVKDTNRGDYTFNKQEHYPEDVWIIPRTYQRGGVKVPTRLPDALAEKIILYGSNPGDLVLDPFCGSGTIPVCAKRLGRRAMGYEIVPAYAKLASATFDAVEE